MLGQKISDEDIKTMTAEEQRGWLEKNKYATFKLELNLYGDPQRAISDRWPRDPALFQPEALSRFLDKHPHFQKLISELPDKIKDDICAFRESQKLSEYKAPTTLSERVGYLKTYGSTRGRGSVHWESYWQAYYELEPQKMVEKYGIDAAALYLMQKDPEEATQLLEVLPLYQQQAIVQEMETRQEQCKKVYLAAPLDNEDNNAQWEEEIKKFPTISDVIRAKEALFQEAREVLRAKGIQEESMNYCLREYVVIGEVDDEGRATDKMGLRSYYNKEYCKLRSIEVRHSCGGDVSRYLDSLAERLKFARAYETIATPAGYNAKKELDGIKDALKVLHKEEEKVREDLEPILQQGYTFITDSAGQTVSGIVGRKGKDASFIERERYEVALNSAFEEARQLFGETYTLQDIQRAYHTWEQGGKRENIAAFDEIAKTVNPRAFYREKIEKIYAGLNEAYQQKTGKTIDQLCESVITAGREAAEQLGYASTHQAYGDHNLPISSYRERSADVIEACQSLVSLNQRIFNVTNGISGRV